MTTTNETKITPGTYTARAIAWHWDTTKDGGMCLKLRLRTTQGHEVTGTLYFDTERADAKGRTAADRSVEAMRAMGLKGDVDTVDENAGGLDAGDVSVVVEINDKGFPFAKYINPLSSFSAFAPPSQDAKRAFFAQMKSRMGAATASARAAGTAPQQRPAPSRPTGFAAPATDDGDDIPF